MEDTLPLAGSIQAALVVEDIEAALDPDGRTVHVSADDGHLHAVPPATGEPTRVSNDRGAAFHYYLHGVSPDGATLADLGLAEKGDGTARTDVYSVPSAGGPDRQLADDDFADDGSEYSPDGRRISSNSEPGSTRPGHAQLFRMTEDGATIEQLTHDDRVNGFPHVSPDGERIAYTSFPPGTLGHPADPDVIVRLMEDGSVRDLVLLVGGQGTINVPGWAPDSRRLADVAHPPGLNPERLALRGAPTRGHRRTHAPRLRG